MKNLKIWQKLALLGIVFVIPFAVVSFQLVSYINDHGIRVAQRELLGLSYTGPVLELLKALQTHRTLSNAALSGDVSARQKLPAAQLEIQKAIAVIDQTAAEYRKQLDLTEAWSTVKTAYAELLNQRTSSPTENFTYHTIAIDAVDRFVDAIGDQSNLLLENDRLAFHLAEVYAKLGPALSESYAQSQALEASGGSNSGLAPEDEAKLRKAGVLSEYLSAEIGNRILEVVANNSELRTHFSTFQESIKTALSESPVTKEETKGAPESSSATDSFREAMAKSIDSVHVLQKHVADELRELLIARVEHQRSELINTFAWAVAGLLVVGAISFFIVRDIAAPLKQAVRNANRIAAGDLDVEELSDRADEVGDLAAAFSRMSASLKTVAQVAARIAGGDLAVTLQPQSEKDVMGHALSKMVSELKKISAATEQIASGDLTVSVVPQSESDVMGNSLAKMVDRLSGLVRQVQHSGLRVNSSTAEIAATSKQQQTTATEIAATTTQIGATSKEISATSRELVRTMNNVARVSDETATVAEGSKDGLARMAETMRHIMDAAGSINAKLAVLNEKAGSINKVVVTITKVADQTNLLSLNAAIEAEKAGEYGRGFSVVATEIRRLADQTAVSSFDIEQMVKEIQSAVSAGVMGMDKFSEEVRRGVAQVSDASTQLEKIIQQVQALSPWFESVNEGMQAQASGAEQISEALAGLCEAAQQTVESLRQSTSTIDQLDEASIGLTNGVARFKLRAA